MYSRKSAKWAKFHTGRYKLSPSNYSVAKTKAKIHQQSSDSSVAKTETQILHQTLGLESAPLNDVSSSSSSAHQCCSKQQSIASHRGFRVNSDDGELGPAHTSDILGLDIVSKEILRSADDGDGVGVRETSQTSCSEVPNMGSTGPTASFVEAQHRGGGDGTSVQNFGTFIYSTLPQHILALGGNIDLAPGRESWRPGDGTYSPGAILDVGSFHSCGAGEDSRRYGSIYCPSASGPLHAGYTPLPDRDGAGQWLGVSVSPISSISRRRRQRRIERAARKAPRPCQTDDQNGDAPIHGPGLDCACVETWGPLSNGLEWYRSADYEDIQHTQVHGSSESIPGIGQARWMDPTNAARGGAKHDSGIYGSVDRVLRRMLSGSWRLPSPHAESSLPLHLKNVGRIDMAVADSYITEECRDRWNYSRGILFSPLSIEGLNHELQTTPIEADLHVLDIPAMLSLGICVPFPQEEICNYVRIFCVEESLKQRRRMINWPHIINKIFPDPGPCELPTHEQIAREIPKFRRASTHDIASYFHHFQLPREMQKYYGFTYAGQTYALSVIPTGQRQCPCLGQALAASIASRVEQASKNPIRVFAYIDNFLILAMCDDDLKAADNHLQSLCAAANISLNSEAPSSVVEFLGVKYDLDASTCSLAEKTVKKLRSLDTASLSNLRSVLRVFGCFTSAARIMRVHLSGIYTTLKFLRRHGKKDVDDSVNVWPCVQQNLNFAIAHVLACGPVDLRIPVGPTTVLYTDACKSGWGVVVITADGKMLVDAGRFEHDEDIQILEARALLRGVQRLPKVDFRQKVEIRIDNSSLSGGLVRGHHRNFTMNGLTEKIRNVLSMMNYELTQITWIDSLSNIADYPSRIWDSCSANA